MCVFVVAVQKVFSTVRISSIYKIHLLRSWLDSFAGSNYILRKRCTFLGEVQICWKIMYSNFLSTHEAEVGI